MTDMKSTGIMAADTYQTLRAAEQEHRYYMDSHTLHVWAGGCPVSHHVCTAQRVAAWWRVQAAQEAYDATPSIAGWTR
jgi:hypothetical protein